MSQYFSKIHRGFLVQQTDKGWIVPQMPNWSNGPVNQGPFSTYQIACHVLDRCIDNSQKSETPKPQEKQSSEPIQTGPVGPVEYIPIWKELIHYLIGIPILLIGIISGFYGLIHTLNFKFTAIPLFVLAILAVQISNKISYWAWK